MYFKKLDLNFTPPEFQLGEREMEYGLNIDNEFRGIWYSGIKEDPDFELKNSYQKNIEINLLFS